ncbi:hypothetical protein [Mesorhizobium sp.]|uniref:hypothetical protein n=1 Tax=Mesorhizobium sp. TaxID=1871066 RepID=UPI000FE8B449|nr:hypothetical protein [Mesorhizobium sp.]RWO49226.1 MAG: response regulator [Mesorhizobium sp.]
MTKDHNLPNQLTAEPDSIQSGPKSSIRESVLMELAKASPKLLIAFLILIGIAFLRQPITAFLSRSTEFGLGPVTLKAAEAKLEQVKLDGTKQAQNFSPEQIKILTDRYSEALSGGRRAVVLWVDDNPQNNKELVDFMDLVGVTVVIARSYPEAMARLEERSFNAVISDWDRPRDLVQQRAKMAGDEFWGSGAQLGRALAKNGCGRHVILFSSESTDERPIPPGVAGQTNNYYELLLMIAHKIQAQTRQCYIEPQPNGGATQSSVASRHSTQHNVH